jgi:nitroreductase
MEVFDAVKTMLAVRSYRSDPIPDEVVTRIVEAARLTGSSQNKQQWSFVVVRDREKLRRLGELASSGRFIADAPLAIAVVVPDSSVGYIDGARATQDMMLVAWEAGIGSNWVGNVNKEPIQELLGVPEGQMVLTIVPFGYPAKEIGKGNKNRKPLEEIAFEEEYGKSYQG